MLMLTPPIAPHIDARLPPLAITPHFATLFAITLTLTFDFAIASSLIADTLMPCHMPLGFRFSPADDY